MFKNLTNVRRVVAIGFQALLLAWHTSAEAQTLAILNQPKSQTNDYGSDVVFTVAASGAEPVFYQWRKNGINLLDYENVAGSQTPSLQLIGVSESDAASYSVILGNNIDYVTSSVVTLTIAPVVVFEDTFENGSSNWFALQGDSNLAVDGAENHTVSGARAVLITNVNQRVFHNLEKRITGRSRLTFWLYDDSQGVALGELRGYTGRGYGRYANPGGLKQELAVGKFTSGFPTNGMGALAGETLDTNKYQGRVWRGTNSGWFNLNGADSPNRSRGWHKFEIERLEDGSTVDFYIDDVLGRRVSGAAFMPLNCVVIGSDGNTNSPDTAGNAWIDDVKVEAYPETFEWQSLASAPPLFDWMKLRETGTNAQVVNRLQVTTVAEVSGAATNGGAGGWVTDSVGIGATGLRGYLDYSLTAPGDDAYRIEVEGREKSHAMPAGEIPLIVSIDGESLGRFNLPYGAASNGFIHCFTPFIRAGSHTVRIFWDNANGYRELYLQTVRLQTAANGDHDSSGMKAWVANRLVAQSGVDVAPAVSAVSPVCIEGRERYLSMMSVLSGADYPLSSNTVCHGAGNRWYANVPLSSNHTTVVETSFQNGGRKETNEIAWQITNLEGSNNMVIRKGDSLLLTALPDGATNGTVNIQISGSGTDTTDAQTPISHQFSQAGFFTVVGGFNGTVTGVLFVKVIDASFQGSVPARVNRGRYWDCTNLPPGVVVERDPRLKMTRISQNERDQQIPTPPPLGTNGRQFRVWSHSAEPRFVVARIGEDGPILDNAAINGFYWYTAPDSYLRRIQGNDDGSAVIESTFIMSPVFPSVTAGLEIIVSGVTFDDGSVTRTLTANDFDALGSCKIRFVRGAGVKTSVCHVTKLYDNNYLIGWK